jgi:hypothetical protein
VSGPVLEITASRRARVGAAAVLRALPRRERRTVGAWCFVDHSGPTPSDDGGMGIGPHPHIGLQTVTWLLEGELVHRDSLGSEQSVRPGQLNLMTAGRGVVHAEEPADSFRGAFQGVQLWVAQPEATRHGPAGFEHHAELPQLELGTATATVLVGGLGDATSSARRDTDHVGAELALRPGTSVVPLAPDHEHAIVVVDGALRIGSDVVTPGHLGYLGLGRDELAIDVTDPVRALLIGGVPFPETVSMWWNFVARTHDEIDAARDEWERAGERFGPTRSALARIPAPVPPWRADA